MSEENLNNNENAEIENKNSVKNNRRRGYHKNYNKKESSNQENQNDMNSEKNNKRESKSKKPETSLVKAGHKSIAKKGEKAIVKREEKSIIKKESFRFKKPSIKIIPLGGIEEIGKNITVFEYENDIIVVDCGLEFPTDDMLGIDLVIPDVSYLVKNKEKVKGMVITHGHEDHIGSIPYVLQQINIPIYATKLTCGLIKGKLEEHHLLRSTKLVEVEQGQTIK